MCTWTRNDATASQVRTTSTGMKSPLSVQVHGRYSGRTSCAPRLPRPLGFKASKLSLARGSSRCPDSPIPATMRRLILRSRPPYACARREFQWLRVFLLHAGGSISYVAEYQRNCSLLQSIALVAVRDEWLHPK